MTKMTTRNNSRWLQVVEKAPVGIMVLSLKGELLDCNPASEQFWQQRNSLAGPPDIIRLLQLELDKLVDLLSTPAQETLTRTLHLQPQAGQPDQLSAWISFRLSGLYDAQGQLDEILVCHSDISDQTYNQQVIENTALGVSAQSGQAFFDSLVIHLARIFDARYAFVGLLEHDGSGHSIRTLALSIEGRISDNFTYSMHKTPCADVMGQKTCAYTSGVQQMYPDDLLLQEMDIDSYIGSPIFSPEGKPIGILVVMDNKPLQRIGQVSSILEIFAARAGAEIQRRQAEEKLKRMAFEDYLTRLPNRASLYQHLKQLLHKPAADTTPEPHSALLLIDLDHFKTINDALGHDIGDEIIRKTAERLRHKLPDDLFVCRIGGDEFVVVSSELKNGITLPEVKLLTDKIQYLLNQPFQIGERILNVSASIGVVMFPQNQLYKNCSELDLMRFADIALYQAKNAGRSQSAYYSPEHQLAVDERLEIERGLRQALTDNQLQLYMQPQVNLDGQILGAEVLLRWLHPEQGMIPPFRFIPIAEESGLILRLGDWVLEQTLQLINQWQSNHREVPQQISVNVSAWQFSQTDFVERVSQQCARYGIAAQQLVLELTESALLHDIEEARFKLQSLRNAGFRISLDDFGTGYSSLAYLRDLPLDELKIDKSFIDEVKTGTNPPLVESMLAIGRHMGLDVIAEGVETEDQARQLHAMGCLRYQGYHYARPMPAQTLPDWIAEHSLQES